MFRNGADVANHLSNISDDQVQPNGVDLTLDGVFKQVEPGRIGRDGKRIGDREKIEPAGERYRLEPAGYIVRYGEVVTVPRGHIGFLYPRSSLLRNSCMLNTAVWDAGYDGRGEGLLEVYSTIEIDQGARIAQLVLAEAEHTGTYDGSYQGENR